MCFDPVSLALTAAATAATAGGNRLNQIAQNKAVKKAAGAESVRQQIYQSQADQNLGDALTKFNPQTMQNNLATATTQRNDAISGNLGPQATGTYDTATQNQPDVVKTTIAKNLSDAVAKSKGEAQRMAALGATGDVMANNNISLDQAGSKAGMIGNFAQNSEKVNGLERQAAMQKRSGLGDALGLAGTAISIGNAISAPSRVGDSIFGGIKNMPAGQFGPGEFSPYARITNNIPSIF